MATHEHGQDIALDAARAGMMMACDLKDAGGVVLLPAGAVLSASNLASLRRRGVAQLTVAAMQAAPDPAVLAAERERQCQRLARLFRRSAHVGATPLLLARLTAYRKAR